MPMIEMYVPEGVLDEETRRTLHERVGRQVLEVEGADYDETPAARALTWMFITELPAGSWSVGGELVGSEQPRFLTRVSVPPGSLDDERRAEVVARVNDAIVQALGEDPGAINNWCHVDEDRTFSGGGRIVSFADLMRFVGLDPEAPRRPVGVQ
jgi:phenylpyruvate tautomerase PptA (4-oxalocrotonate tautomerase family)